LQRTELFDHQEPEDNAGPAGVEEVLPAVPEAHAAQGSQIIVNCRFAIVDLKFNNQKSSIFN
jgi:hypothetical protein